MSLSDHCALLDSNFTFVVHIARFAVCFCQRISSSCACVCVCDCVSLYACMFAFSFTFYFFLLLYIKIENACKSQTAPKRIKK